MTPKSMTKATIDLTRDTRLVPAVDYAAIGLTRLRHYHIGWMLDLLADPTISHYEPLGVALSAPEAFERMSSFVERLSEIPASAQAWVVIEGGRRVGTCQLRRSGDGHLVGVSLEAAVRNRGLGTALFRTLGHWGRRDGDFVAGEVEDDNLPCHAALRCAGYGPEDRYGIVLADGRHTTVTRYEFE